MVGTGRDSWRTDTMGLGGGPQDSNLFPQAERLSSSRSLVLEYAGGGLARSAALDSEAQARRELTTKPSVGANGPLPVWFRLLNPTFSLYENI